MVLCSGILENDLDAVFRQWGVSVTYRHVAWVFGAVSGTVTPTPVDESATAIRSTAAVGALDEADGQLMREVVVFRIRTAELADPPTRGDQVIDGSETFEVFGWTLSPDEVLWEILTTR